MCRTCGRESSRKWDRKNPRRRLFLNKRADARKNGIEFTLKFEDIEWPTHCPVLGIELDYERHRDWKGATPAGKDNSPSFDRLDPSEGYVPGNVAVISNRANTIKNHGTPAEHRLIADWMEGVTYGR